MKKSNTYSHPPLILSQWHHSYNYGVTATIDDEQGILTIVPDAQRPTQIKKYLFSFIYEPAWTKKRFEALCQLIDKNHQPQISSEHIAILILPYLPMEFMEQLWEKHINGLDLCGNACLHLDHRTIIITGNPNCFTPRQKTVNPYRSKAALVGRMLLDTPVFSTAQQLRKAIQQKKGSISQAYISRALQALADDTIIPTRSNIYVQQADTLLDKLAYHWQPQTNRVWQGRVNLPLEEVQHRLFHNAIITDTQTIMTGIASAHKYVAFTIEPTLYLYTDNIAALLTQLPIQERQSFVNVVICEPKDKGVYFNGVTDDKGIIWASRLQSYLELVNGNAREQEMARILQEQLLQHVHLALQEYTT